MPQPAEIGWKRQHLTALSIILASGLVEQANTRISNVQSPAAG